MRRAGFEQAERSFEQTLARFTAVQLNGYRALATGLGERLRRGVLGR